MSIVVIRATIACDACGRHFRVEMDPASDIPEGWSLADLAEDVVRGGTAHIGEAEPQRHATSIDTILSGLTSVQDDKMLCVPCTRDADAQHCDEEEEPA